MFIDNDIDSQNSKFARILVEIWTSLNTCLISFDSAGRWARNKVEEKRMLI